MIQWGFQGALQAPGTPTECYAILAENRSAEDIESVVLCPPDLMFITDIKACDA
jgi:hypothetical protein